MTAEELTGRSRRQLADYDARSPGSLFAEASLELAVDEAYALQLETSRLRVERGEAVAGYKIGCVSPVVQEQLGVDGPVFGHLFQSEIHTDGAVLAAADFAGLAIEGELAVELGREVGRLEEVRGEPARFIAKMFPVIELHHYSFRGARPSAAELIANNALHAGFVLAADAVPAAARGVEIEVWINGELRGSTLYDPLESLPTLVAMLAARGIRPQPGQWLLTGSPLPLYRVGPGNGIEVRCPPASVVRAVVAS